MKNFNHRGHGEHRAKDLKPVLRELAARSEKLTEFAMVRDANGRYVEVEEGGGGFPVGGAIKAGVGAAALGGAGYGGYRGHKYVMDKFNTIGPMEAGKNRVVEAYKGAGAAGWNAAKAGGQAGLDSFRAAGQGVANSAQAAGAAVGAAGQAAATGVGNAAQAAATGAGNAAQSGMNAAKKSGFGRRLRGFLVGAARWMK